MTSVRLRWLAPPPDPAPDAAKEKYAADRKAVRDPVLHIRIAVQRRDHLQDLDQSADCGQSEKQDPQPLARKREPGKETEHGKGRHVLELVIETERRDRRPRQQGHDQSDAQGQPEQHGKRAQQRCCLHRELPERLTQERGMLLLELRAPMDQRDGSGNADPRRRKIKASGAAANRFPRVWDCLRVSPGPHR